MSEQLQQVIASQEGYFNKKVAGLVAGAGVVGLVVGMYFSSSEKSEDAPRAPEAAAPVIDVPAEAQLIADAEAIPPGVVGEGPCGPEIDEVVASERFAAGELVVKPTETDIFWDNRPELDTALSNFWKEVDTNPNDAFLNALIEELSVTQPEMLEDGEDNSVIEELKARMEFAVLTDELVIQNHWCDEDSIFEVENINKLMPGEQVWGITLTEGFLNSLEEKDITIPSRMLVTNHPSGASDTPFLVLERGPCNNAVTERDIPTTEETTTTTGDDEETTTTTEDDQETTTTTEDDDETTPTTRPTTTTQPGPTSETTTPPKQDDGNVSDPRPTTSTTVEQPSGSGGDPNRTPTTSTTAAPNQSPSTTVEAPGSSTTTTSSTSTTTTTMAGSNNGTTTTTRPTEPFNG